MSVGLGHGKAILVGEHLVLDGAAAVAIGLHGMRTAVELHRAGPDDGEIPVVSLDTTDLEESARHDAERMLVRGAVLAGLSGRLQATVRSTVPVRRGLGSSAALAVAVVRAAHDLAWNKPPDELTLLSEARAIECVVHGQSSGLDPAAAAGVGAVMFQNGTVVRRLTTASPRLADARWVLIDSGPGAPTREAIARSRAARDRMGPQAAAALVDEADTAAHQAFDALANGDLAALAEALRQAGQTLVRLDVVTARMAKILQDLQDHGALAAKQTGAGLGGMLLALAPSEAIALDLCARTADHTAGSWILPLVPQDEPELDLLGEAATPDRFFFKGPANDTPDPQDRPAGRPGELP